MRIVQTESLLLVVVEKVVRVRLKVVDVLVVVARKRRISLALRRRTNAIVLARTSTLM
jgi:hypothetical protein